MSRSGASENVLEQSGTRAGLLASHARQDRISVLEIANDDNDGNLDGQEEGSENLGAIDEFQVQGFSYKLSDEVKHAIASYDGPGQIIITAKGEVLAQLEDGQFNYIGQADAGNKEVEYGYEGVSHEMVVESANALLRSLGVRNTVIATYNDLVRSVSTLFVVAFQNLFGVRLKGAIKVPGSFKDQIHNAQLVVDTLSNEVLGVELGHITGEAICNGDAEAIENLIDIFSEIKGIMSSRHAGEDSTSSGPNSTSASSSSSSSSSAAAGDGGGGGATAATSSSSSSSLATSSDGVVAAAAAAATGTSSSSSSSSSSSFSSKRTRVRRGSAPSIAATIGVKSQYSPSKAGGTKRKAKTFTRSKSHSPGRDRGPGGGQEDRGRYADVQIPKFNIGGVEDDVRATQHTFAEDTVTGFNDVGAGSDTRDYGGGSDSNGHDDERGGGDPLDDSDGSGEREGHGSTTYDEFHVADDDLQQDGNLQQDQDGDALEDSSGARKPRSFPEGGFGARVEQMDTKIEGGDINLNDDNMVEAYLVLEADRRRERIGEEGVGEKPVTLATEDVEDDNDQDDNDAASSLSSSTWTSEDPYLDGYADQWVKPLSIKEIDYSEYEAETKIKAKRAGTTTKFRRKSKLRYKKKKRGLEPARVAGLVRIYGTAGTSSGSNGSSISGGNNGANATAEATFSSSFTSASLPLRSQPPISAPRATNAGGGNGSTAGLDLGLGIYSSDGLDFPEGMQISDMDKDVAIRVRRAKQQYKRLLKTHIRNMRTEKLQANLAKANFQALTDIGGAGGFSPEFHGHGGEHSFAHEDESAFARAKGGSHKLSSSAAVRSSPERSRSRSKNTSNAQARLQHQFLLRRQRQQRALLIREKRSREEIKRAALSRLIRARSQNEVMMRKLLKGMEKLERQRLIAERTEAKKRQRQLKEKRRKRMEAMEHFWRNRCQMVKEQIAEEKKKKQVHDAAQRAFLDKMAREIERSRTEQLDRVLTKLVGEEDDQSFAPASEYITGLAVPQSIADVYEGIGIGSRGKSRGIGGLLAGKGRKLQREFEKIECQHREAWTKLGKFLAEDEDGVSGSKDAWEMARDGLSETTKKAKKMMIKKKRKKKQGGDKKSNRVSDDDLSVGNPVTRLSVAGGLQVYAAQKVSQVHRKGAPSKPGKSVKGKAIIAGRTTGNAGNGVASTTAAAATVVAKAAGASAAATGAVAGRRTAAVVTDAAATSSTTTTTTTVPKNGTASRIVKMGLEKTATAHGDWGVMIKKKLRAWAGSEASPTHAGDGAHEAGSPHSRRRASGLKRFPAREDLNRTLGSAKPSKGKKKSGGKVKRKTKADRMREAERIAKLVHTYAR